jgi:signal transduction histidine kinase
MVGEVWELLAPPPSAQLELVQPLPVIRTSRVELQQILLNLIGNAIKHNADRELRIEVGAQRDGKLWKFFVADNKIWGLFQTLERRDKVESTGIGLSVVRKIVESHGGTTWVESELGRGATFWFTWTADAEEPPRV